MLSVSQWLSALFQWFSATSPLPPTPPASRRWDFTRGKNGYTAHADTTGDPHNNVVNKDKNGKQTSEEKYDFQGHAGNTYNMMYDPSTGFTENATFKAYGNGGATVVSQEGLKFDGNKLLIKAGANGEEAYLNGDKLEKGSYLGGEVVVGDNKVTVKADNFSYEVDEQGSGSGAYLDTHRDASNAGDTRLGLDGVVGSVIADPKAKTDFATLEQDQVSGLFSNPGASPYQTQGSQNGSNTTRWHSFSKALATFSSSLRNSKAICRLEFSSRSFTEGCSYCSSVVADEALALAGAFLL